MTDESVVVDDQGNLANVVVSIEDAPNVDVPIGGPVYASEMDLRFTPDDLRENVLRNRELLAEAISGDPFTPLATLRQIHSNVLIAGGPASATRTASR